MHQEATSSKSGQVAKRPDFAPENRSAGAGKIVAVSVFALLLLGALATLVVVLTRGRTKFADPDAGLARPPAEMQPAGTPETRETRETPETPETPESTESTESGAGQAAPTSGSSAPSGI